MPDSPSSIPEDFVEAKWERLGHDKGLRRWYIRSLSKSINACLPDRSAAGILCLAELCGAEWRDPRNHS